MTFIRTMIAAALVSAFTIAAPAIADDVTMTFGDSTPPYAFPKNASGLEVDIIREALAHAGHTLVPRFVPAARVERQFKQGLVDAASKDPARVLEGPDAHYGDVSVEYFVVLISLQTRGLTLSTPDDLDGLKVIAFQNAHKFFPDWLSKPHSEGRYTETANQMEQVRAILDGVAVVAVADRSIFTYHLRELAAQTDMDVPALDFADFTSPLQVRPVFRSQQMRDDFNAGLAHLRSSGRYAELLEKYLN